MIRITELPLPLDYAPDALRQAVVKRLKIRQMKSGEKLKFKKNLQKSVSILLVIAGWFSIAELLSLLSNAFVLDVKLKQPQLLSPSFCFLSQSYHVFPSHCVGNALKALVPRAIICMNGCRPLWAPLAHLMLEGFSF